MKALNIGLLDNLVTVYGDTTKTFVTSRVKQKTIGGVQALGAPLNKFFSVFDDTGVSPNSIYVSPNGRVFAMGAIAAGLGRCSLYDWDETNGTYSFIGSLTLTFINSPATTHTIRAFKVDDGANNAAVTGWRIFVATTGTVTANGGPYMAMSIAKTDFTAVPVTIPTATLADSKQVYKLENSPFTLTQSVGMGQDRTNTRQWLQNGVSATYQFAKFNYGGSTGTPGANGIITTFFEFITGNLPALSGTLLLTNCNAIVTPTASPNPAPLLGSQCMFFMTGTTAYLGLVSELTNGGTTWPSLSPSNYVTPNPFINPTPTAGYWDSSIDRMIGNGGQGAYFVKPILNNSIDYIFGQNADDALESGFYLSKDIIQFLYQTSTQVASRNGWMFAISTTVQQRGITALPILSDLRYTTDYIITKVLDTPSTAFYQASSIFRAFPKLLVPPKAQYRTSGFGSQTAGWIDLPDNFDMSSLATGSQVQFRILFRVVEGGNANAQQLTAMFLLVQQINELSDNWEYSKNQSDSGSPTRVAFRLLRSYSVSVPKLFFRAFDLTDVNLVTHDTVANAARFEYSTDNGTSWNPLGTIPNTVGTLVRYNFLSPPGVDIAVSLRET